MERKVHYYLHEQAIGVTTVKRIDANTVFCMLPEEGGEYQLSVNEKEQRALVAFDGELLFGGLPRSATVVASVSLGVISCPSGSVRKNSKYPCEAVPNFQEGKNEARIEIFRHFLLLPSCTAIVRKFRNKSLSPIYTIIRVFVNEKGARVVEWQTTSY